LVYNFLQIAQVERSSFFQVMGPIRNIEFMGAGFNKWVFPVCLICMFTLTLFNVFGRALSCLGLKQYGFDDDY